MLNKSIKLLSLKYFYCGTFKKMRLKAVYKNRLSDLNQTDIDTKNKSK